MRRKLRKNRLKALSGFQYTLAMTRTDDTIQREQRIVLVFDICSSTQILEHLIVRNSEISFRNILLRLKGFLEHRQGIGQLAIYKFVGDGWIVLFDTSTKGTELLNLLHDLQKEFRAAFNELIRSELDVTPTECGLTFGIDLGQLVRFQAFGQTEYIGRPLNMATRLQSAVKDGGTGYAGKALMSTKAFSYLKIGEFLKVVPVKRELRNVLGGQQVECFELAFPFLPAIAPKAEAREGLFGTGYILRNFDQREFKNLLIQIENSVPRKVDVSFVFDLEQDLLGNPLHLRKTTLKRLAKWCNTGGPYASAQPSARKLSELLFGEILDRDRVMKM